MVKALHAGNSLVAMVCTSSDTPTHITFFADLTESGLYMLERSETRLSPVKVTECYLGYVVYYGSS